MKPTLSPHHSTGSRLYGINNKEEEYVFSQLTINIIPSQYKLLHFQLTAREAVLIAHQSWPTETN